MTIPRVPSATYRLQLTPDFGFSAAAAVVPYLASLGVSHVYCSPVFEAAAGSTHGYDVVDPARLRTELGGAEGFAALVSACHEHDLGLVVDVVPNHMYVGAPQDANVAWWDVLRRGQASPFAKWFDIDWQAPGLDGKVLVPVLGNDPQFEVVGDTLRYGEHVLPLMAGTQQLPVDQLLTRQHYRLAPWQEESRTLNYRRFFGISTLAGVRVEERDVFDATHRLVGELTRRGVVHGVRIDHPDGLADPAGYLEALHEVTGGTWTVVEKILEADEELPPDWRCDGTTGYDALNFVDGLFVDRSAEGAMTSTYADFIGSAATWDDVAHRAKIDAVDRMLAPEVARLSRSVAAELGEPLTVVTEAVRALLVAMPIYRAYVRPGEPPPSESVDVVTRVAAEAALTLSPDAAKAVHRIRELLLTGSPEVVTRFQQTSGPAMAKGVEDTAFYRFHRLASLCEVGGDPGRFGRSIADFHEFCARIAERRPATMTTLSTHDTKRAEDVRARIAVLTEVPDEWRAAVQRWSGAAASYRGNAGPDRNTEYLIWQTLVGAWPIDVARMTAYVEKATREAGEQTAWVDGDPQFDDDVAAFVAAVLDDGPICADISAFVARIETAATANTLAQKLVQLTMPGVPDVYQGCELVDRSLVDPDNRRAVDYNQRATLLDAGTDPKLDLVAKALRLRRGHPEWFGPDAAFVPLAAVGAAADHVVAFQRGDGAVVLATRLAERLGQTGGWQDTTIELPPGKWVDAISGDSFVGGRLHMRDLLHASPVALLGKTTPTHS